MWHTMSRTVGAKQRAEDAADLGQAGNAARAGGQTPGQ